MNTAKIQKWRLEPEHVGRKETELLSTQERPDLSMTNEYFLCRSEDLGVAFEELLKQKRRVDRAHLNNCRILDAIRSILVGVDDQGNISRWNKTAESVFRISTAEVLDRPFTQLKIPWSWSPLLDAYQKCRTNKRLVKIEELPFIRGDGTQGFLGLTVNPLSLDEEGHYGVLILGADITERMTLEQQLRHAQKLESIGQLAAGIAHEINTPTQYIGDNLRFLSGSFDELVNMLRTLKKIAYSDGNDFPNIDLPMKIRAAMEAADVDYLLEEVPDAVIQSLEGVERVSKIVGAMKDFTYRGEEKALADINRAIESTITVARNEWKYTADMVTDFDPTLSSVPCLLSEFNQVVLNMIINASHAIADVVGDETQTKGTISITTRNTGNWAEVLISDTGAGIPHDIQQRIFEPFFTTKEVGKGTGQGLSIAHTVIVQKHGGTISVDSKVGEGTSFLIKMPFNKVTADADSIVP